MPERSVHVLHVLVPRRVAGETQVFLHDHPLWRESPSGRPLLALPTTKLPRRRTGDPVGGRLRAVLNDDLGLPELGVTRWHPFAEVETRTVSPTQGVVSRYRIAPVLTRLPAITHGRAVRKASGRWLPLPVALARPDLSPTARAVLQRVDAGELLPPPPLAADLAATGERGIAARLAAARDGDMEQFAAVVRELEPVLTQRLRGAACTRALASRLHDLEDVVAIAFAAALEHLEQYDRCRGSASGWLWIIARNAAVSLLRRDGRTTGLTPEMAQSLADSDDPTAFVETREETANMQTQLDAALEQATPMMRRAWALRMNEGRPYAEIAKLLKVPFGTVATWIRRIKQMAAESGDCAE